MAFLRSLHLACLPFPTPQGTQAWVGAMMSALLEAGEDATLMTYESGQGGRPDSQDSAGFPWIRVPGTRSSLRSGPSLLKIQADVRMVGALRRATTARSIDVVFAHNIEAAWVARAARLACPFVYVAHTRMVAELPTYLPRRFSSILQTPTAALGFALDYVASQRVPVAAVSPSLAARFEGTYLPPPWSLPSPVREEERAVLRRRLGLFGPVALYAGNLDAYQNWPSILAARDFGYTLVVATESDPAELSLMGSDTRILSLKTEKDRRRAHAVADVALVPRGAEGGLPIKLIDALSRGVPVVANTRALAGLQPDGVTSAQTLRGALRKYQHLAASNHQGGLGRDWVRRECSAQRFVEAYRAVTHTAYTARRV